MVADLFTRHPDNPILTAEDIPYPCGALSSPGATIADGETVLLLRVEDRRGMSHLTVARSADGLADWRVDPRPSWLPSPGTHPDELWGIEDARITAMEAEGDPRWLISYCASGPGGRLIGLASTEDFARFERLGVAFPPDNRAAALFPRRFDGRYAMLHRPAGADGAHVWLSMSPDLRHWGDHRMLLLARSGGWWDAGRVGLATPPLQTPDGWLVMYHGQRRTRSGPVYRLGLALLDGDDPRRLLVRGDEWVFAPREIYERGGDEANVPTPRGWTIHGDELRVYYGAAGSGIALARASLADISSWLYCR